MSTWTQTKRRTLDLRGELLPPTWCPRSHETAEPPIEHPGYVEVEHLGLLPGLLDRLEGGTTAVAPV